MRTLKIMAFFIFGFTLVACGNNKNENPDDAATEIEQDNTVIDDHNSKTSLDWAGIYEGTLPCADCEAIETMLILNESNTFSLHETYIKGGEETSHQEKGTFTWDSKGSVITLEITGSPDTYQYKVGENRLFALDQDGEEVDGALADNYILTKSAEL